MEFSLTMDNDSGYVSHYQESNLDSSSENTYSTKAKSFFSQDIYISEDALQEKPAVKNGTEYRRYGSFDSLINGSQESVKTEFSGFDDSDRSDISFAIPEVKSIVWDSNASWTEDNELENLNPENLNSSQFSDAIINQATLKRLTPHKPLANVTNTFGDNVNSTVIKNVLTDSNKENIHPSQTPKKQYENRVTSDISPDLFGEEEEICKVKIPVKEKSPIKKKMPNNYCDNKDIKLLRKVQSSLSGVHPPPSLTIVQMTVTEMLTKIEDNKDCFWTCCNFKATEAIDWTSSKWPEILKYRHFGLYHNRSKVSEDFEHLCSRYAERYVGAETQSTCTVFESNPPSSHKRKFAKPKWGAKSPGRRLSHLARRRITFSNTSFQGTSNSSILGSRARQILVDAKKLNMLNKKSPRKSPRKTPSKSPFKIKRNTPSSSAKKKLAMKYREMSGEFGSAPSTSTSSSTFKRALFSSPKQDKSALSITSIIEKKSTKRALFLSPVKRSSPNKSPLKIGKRKRTDFDDENPSKFARSLSMELKPTHSESKSVMSRTLSETMVKNHELSEQHKKKLQWAVYESLRLQNVTPEHPQYKIFASVLARVTRKFLPNLRMEGRTTEKMFRIARYHSYAVVKGKSVDEIVNEYMRNRLKNQKPQGYIGIEEFQNLKNKETSVLDKENVLQSKNIIESIEKRREHAGNRTKFLSENRLDRIKKVISFEDNK